MAHQRLPLLWLLFPLGACATNEYVCPKPIGKIIRDDCEVYRTRFETLKAELSASVGPVSASVKLGKEKLRDPSQLIQVLAHRTYALCRDFNACRVGPQDYRERRERTERIFTAVGAISAQLKHELPDGEKAKLVAKLASLLEEDRSPRARRLRGRAGAVRSARPRWAFYRSWLPWFNTKMLPPQPPALLAKGPTVAHVTYSIGHVFRSRRGVVGYSLRARFLLRGKLAPDDLLTMGYGGKSVDCKLSRSRYGVNGMVSVSCPTDRNDPITAAVLPVTLNYAPEGEGKPQPIGRHVLKVLSRVSNPKNGSRIFAEDHDDKARRVKLVFRPAGNRLPPAYEQPSLYAVLKMRDTRRKTLTARCWVNGKLATSAIRAYGRRSGHVGQFQDRQRYRQVSPGRSVRVRRPFVMWRRYDFPLPFHLAHEGRGTPPANTKPWPKPGSWRCVISLDGEPVREARFVVKDSGRLEPSALQTQHPEAGWLLDTKVIPSKKEEPL